MGQHHAALLLFKKDDESLMKIVHNYKFHECILPANQEEYVYIIDKSRVGFIFLRFLLQLRIPAVSEVAGTMKKFGCLVSAYVCQRPLIQDENVPDAAYRSSLCTVCDETFSRLWEPYMRSCDISLSRDTETLNWLYFSSARLYKRVVIQCHRSRDSALAGYMVFDLIRIHPADEAIMKLMDMCVHDSDPEVLASLTSYAIRTGEENNAALLIVWAHDQETEQYFNSAFAIRMHKKYYRYVRFSDTYRAGTGGDNYSTVCLPMIYPPQ